MNLDILAVINQVGIKSFLTHFVTAVLGGAVVFFSLQHAANQKINIFSENIGKLEGKLEVIESHRNKIELENKALKENLSVERKALLNAQHKTTLHFGEKEKLMHLIDTLKEKDKNQEASIRNLHLSNTALKNRLETLTRSKSNFKKVEETIGKIQHEIIFLKSDLQWEKSDQKKHQIQIELDKKIKTLGEIRIKKADYLLAGCD